jgi:hypothetical protein
MFETTGNINPCWTGHAILAVGAVDFNLTLIDFTNRKSRLDFPSGFFSRSLFLAI